MSASASASPTDEKPPVSPAQQEAAARFRSHGGIPPALPQSYEYSNPFAPPLWLEPSQRPQQQQQSAALEQHAQQFGHTHQPAFNAPQPRLHRGSSDASVATTSTTNDKVPIPRASRSGSSQGVPSLETETVKTDRDAPAMVVSPSGPISSSVTVPARPKPGRKPMAPEKAEDRRRVQNRMAQRSFRDKRQQKLVDVTNELDEYKQRHQEMVAQMERRLEEQRQSHQQAYQALKDALEQRCKDLERENQALRTQNQTPRTQQQFQAGQFRPAQVHSVPPQTEISPPSSENDMEIDFTSYRRDPQVTSLQVNASHDNSSQMDYSFAAGDTCGFCDSSQTCLCAQGKVAEVEKPVPVSEPGSCDQCRADPKRAQACRDMATSIQTSASGNPRQNSAIASTSMPPPARTSCSSMIDEFNRHSERTSSITRLFGGQLRTYPSTSGGGYDLDEQQAAQVLSNLSRRSATAESPRS